MRYDDGRLSLEGFKNARDILKRDPSLAGGWGWWVLLRGSWPTLIGVVSPKGPPDRDGTVEISYGIVDSHQDEGYATEATSALIAWIREDPRVRRILAETPPSLAAARCALVKPE